MLNEQFLRRISDLMVALAKRNADRLKMQTFGGRQAEPCITLDEALDCGTSGCAIGWAWTCLEPSLPGEEGVSYFSRTCFVKEATCWQEDIIFYWLFENHWPDDPLGVAKRIDWLLSNGPDILFDLAEADNDWRENLWKTLC